MARPWAGFAEPGRTFGRLGGALPGHPGLRDVGHDRDPRGELLAGRWVPVHSISALKCAQVTLSSSS